MATAPWGQGEKKRKEVAVASDRSRALRQIHHDTPQTAKHDTLGVHCSVDQDLEDCAMAKEDFIVHTTYKSNRCPGLHHLTGGDIHTAINRLHYASLYTVQKEIRSTEITEVLSTLMHSVHERRS